MSHHAAGNVGAFILSGDMCKERKNVRTQAKTRLNNAIRDTVKAFDCYGGATVG